jgi:hypothetical protein
VTDPDVDAAGPPQRAVTAQEMYLWKALGDHLRGAVGRAVVHDNSLEAPERLCPKQMKEALNERLPIEDGKNDIDIRAANRVAALARRFRRLSGCGLKAIGVARIVRYHVCNTTVVMHIL